MAERHDSPDHKAFRAAFTKSAQEPNVGTKWRCSRAERFMFSRRYSYRKRSVVAKKDTMGSNEDVRW